MISNIKVEDFYGSFMLINDKLRKTEYSGKIFCLQNRFLEMSKKFCPSRLKTVMEYVSFSRFIIYLLLSLETFSHGIFIKNKYL